MWQAALSLFHAGAALSMPSGTVLGRRWECRCESEKFLT